ncbi:YdcF family protein [Lentilitoribacter sp. EG35]|uniref:YdcF family protein n=1 Tax=Lentilitoribacter sp. EG35 TaxID=3234192 RepID=UPI00345F686B
MTAEEKPSATENAELDHDPIPEKENSEEYPLRKKNKLNWFFTPLALIGILFIAITISAFVRFAEDVSSLRPAEDLDQADAIVVLTGGTKRITQAVKLLEQGVGKMLFISGVNPDISDQTLQRVSGASQETFDCCIMLGRNAKNTIGNGKEITKWANKNDYKKLVVVTSNYHMIRSLYELKAVDKNTTFLPYPVATTDLKDTSWISDSDVIRALINEFAKLNYAYFRDFLNMKIANNSPS